MTLRINNEAPNFVAETTEGTVDFHEWIGDGWAILFSHPKDFTPVCTTELGAVAGLKGEFEKRNCKIMGISVDGVANLENSEQMLQTETGRVVQEYLEKEIVSPKVVHFQQRLQKLLYPTFLISTSDRISWDPRDE